jgi:NAD(P)-dependent dehydrogenase (short-subunit alcohol dehydrogenase family)
MSKVWFVTGASRGFGRIWTEAALSRGDRVAATARVLESVADLSERFGDAVLPLALDVTDAEQVENAVRQAHAHFGRLDVVLNNAGYALMGAVEEASDADVLAVFDANVFGTHRVIRAALPLLRRQGGGHIVGVSSGLGITAMPLGGFYSATKWAFEGLHESLAAEVKGFGIAVTLVEPGAYATTFGSAASVRLASATDAYGALWAAITAHMSTMEHGDPRATVAAVLKLVDLENPPLRFALGNTILPRAREAYASRIAEWEAYDADARAAQGTRTDAPMVSV